MTIAALVVCDAAAAYQVGVRARRPPSFRRGGRFVEASGVEAPSPATLPANETTTTGVALGPAPGSSATTRTPTTATRVHVPATTLAPAAAPAGAAAGPLPASGTYTWDVSGTEAASGFGSRDFPSTMTMHVHRNDPSLRSDEVVVDSTYSSNHNEREILGVESDGIYFDFEAGQVRFGPSAQTNQGDYRPPMLQVPLPLSGGLVRNGTTQVIAGDGSTQRTENWTVTVLGQETIQVAGRSVVTWKVTVDRHGSGGNQKVDRSRTLWYDPAHKIWVKYTEKLHGEQNYGITFTYDENVTATLLSFTPG